MPGSDEKWMAQSPARTADRLARLQTDLLMRYHPPTCSKCCEPLFSMARVKGCQNISVEEYSVSARKTHLEDGLQANQFAG